VVTELWNFEHSVICAVSVDFAWRFWTDVRNWAFDADIESVELNGQFESGSMGVTTSRSAGTIEWRLAEVGSGWAVVEFPLPGAIGRFHWTFAEDRAGTRITQQATLLADSEQPHFAPMLRGMESGIPAGMEALCAEMRACATRNVIL
jgi:hypothetical protein